MAQPTQPYLDELMSALRGCWALVMGRRDASSYFDFSQRGLVGSLIAVLLAMLLAGFGPLALGVPAPAGAATQSIVVNLVLFVAQAAMAWLVLRQIGRQDGFLPYLVASNWVTFVSSVLLVISVGFGSAGLVMLAVVAIFALVTFINIGRLIVTLAPLQIGILFLSQAVGVFLALGIVAVLLPPPVV